MSAANVLERAANEELSKHGITLRQVQVLGALAIFGEQTQAVLADRLLVESSTLVRILDRMERDGWVERVPLADRPPGEARPRDRQGRAGLAEDSRLRRPHS